MDIEDAKGHALRVFNEIYSDRRDFASDGDPGPEAEFILGGWSWRAGRFRIWHLAWDATSAKFEFRQVTPRRNLNDVWVWFAGSDDAVKDARLELDRMLRTKRSRNETSIDLEPLTIIAMACASGAYRDVGGAPQVLKVYRHMNTQQFAVEWRSGGPTDPVQLHVGGRPLLPYEVAHLPSIPLEAFLGDTQPAARGN